MECEKQKDAEPFSSMAFNLKKVDLGYGQSSCVLEPTEFIESGAQAEATTKKVFTVLEEFGTVWNLIGGFPCCQGCIRLQWATHTSFESRSDLRPLIADRVTSATHEA